MQQIPLGGITKSAGHRRRLRIASPPSRLGKRDNIRLVSAHTYRRGKTPTPAVLAPENKMMLASAEVDRRRPASCFFSSVHVRKRRIHTTEPSKFPDTTLRSHQEGDTAPPPSKDSFIILASEIISDWYRLIPIGGGKRLYACGTGTGE